jgi:hypothetical protein
MNAMFYLAPGMIAFLALCTAYGVVRRTVERRLAWRSGLTAEARCLRAYTTAHSDSEGRSNGSTWHHVYEYAAADGRSIRFEERNGPATTLEGDFVTVHYTAGRPQRATAFAPDSGTSEAKALLILAFLGVVVAFCVAFVSSVPTDG